MAPSKEQPLRLPARWPLQEDPLDRDLLLATVLETKPYGRGLHLFLPKRGRWISLSHFYRKRACKAGIDITIRAIQITVGFDPDTPWNRRESIRQVEEAALAIKLVRPRKLVRPCKTTDARRA